MKLRPYLVEQDIAPAAFAETVGVSAAALYRYMAGDRVPRRRVLEAITKATGGKVQPNDFFAAANPARQPEHNAEASA